ncbi:MAG: FKBP-type peptidyl-prolyl cis-trans isomerase [Burkholderiaceae bacterium]
MPSSEAPIQSVSADSYLTLHYRVSVDAAATHGESAAATGNDVVSTFGTQPATLQLGAGQLSPALEERLLGLSVGAHRVFFLAPNEAFGPRNPALVQQLPRKVLEAESDTTDYLPGDVVEFNAPGGGRYAGVFRSLDNDYAIFDFNHPLAGQPVRFEVRIVGIL